MLSELHISTVFLTFEVKVILQGTLDAGLHVSPVKLDPQSNPSCDVKLSFLVLKGQTVMSDTHRAHSGLVFPESDQ